MKGIMNKVKRMLAVLLAFAMVSTAADWSVLTVLAKESGSESVTTATFTVDPETGETVYHLEPIYLENVFQTSVLDRERSGDNMVPLKSTDEVRWIDRIADMPEGTMDFYNALIEGADNDGVDDFLIDPGTGDYFVYGSTVTVPFEPTDSNKEVLEKLDAAYQDLYWYMVAAYAAFDRDCPEVFWLNGSVWIWSDVELSDSQNEAYLTLKLPIHSEEDDFDVRDEAYMDPAVLRAEIANRDIWAEEILMGAAGLSDYEAICYFNQ